MHTIIIIDDEYYFRQAIIKYISNYNEQYTVIAEANNGKNGIEKIKEFKPDIILIDITMPQMDGFEVIDYVKRNNINAKFVIISGYDRFEYVQKALRLGVQDFLLKPVTQEALLECLEKVSMLIRQEENHSTHKLPHTQTAPIGYLRSQLALNLIQSNECMQDLNQLSLKTGFPLNASSYAVFLFSICQLSDNWEKADHQLFYFSIDNIICETLGETAHCVSYVNSQGSLCMVLSIPELDNDTFPSWSMGIVSHAMQILDSNHLSKIICSIGNPSTFNDIRKSYMEALAVERYHLFYESYGIFFYDNNISSHAATKSILSEKMKQQLLTSMRKNDTVFLQETIDTIFDSLTLSKVPPNYFLIQINELLSIIMDYASACGIDHSASFIQNFAVSELLTVYSVSEIRERILQIIELLIQQVQNPNLSSSHFMIRKIKEYIKINYSNPELHLNMIADALGINLQHMCFLFKKYTNTTIGEYILKTRMDAAKKLLDNSVHNVTEVSLLVGFNDISYFSKCFKKYYGISPKRYLIK